MKKPTIQQVATSHNKLYQRATDKIRKRLIYEASLEVLGEIQNEKLN